MIIGGAILALSVIIGVIIAVIGVVTTLGSDFEEFPGGSGTFTAEQGEVIQLYAEEGTAAPTCTLYTGRCTARTRHVPVQHPLLGGHLLGVLRLLHRSLLR